MFHVSEEQGGIEPPNHLPKTSTTAELSMLFLRQSAACKLKGLLPVKDDGLADMRDDSIIQDTTRLERIDLGNGAAQEVGKLLHAMTLNPLRNVILLGGLGIRIPDKRTKLSTGHLPDRLRKKIGNVGRIIKTHRQLFLKIWD